ncbi:serine hydrolase, partial [Bradyrhizobium uaiense]
MPNNNNQETDGFASGRPSRRGALQLFLGGAAVVLAPEGRFGAMTTAQAETAFADGLSRGRPDEQGIAPSAILDFLDEVDRQGYELHSFMLWRNGQVVAEGWWSPYRADRNHMMHSLTKSVTVSAVGLAMADKRFGLHDKAVSFFKDKLPPDVDDKLAAMTV